MKKLLALVLCLACLCTLIPGTMALNLQPDEISQRIFDMMETNGMKIDHTMLSFNTNVKTELDLGLKTYSYNLEPRINLTIRYFDDSWYVASLSFYESSTALLGVVLSFLMGATGMNELDSLNAYTSLVNTCLLEDEASIKEGGYTFKCRRTFLGYRLIEVYPYPFGGI